MTKPRTPALIGVDWGTSSLRAYLIGKEGTILDRQDHALGITRIADGNFAGTLDDLAAPWRRDHAGLPILLSGMIGSRQGWAEAPYTACPADIGALAGKLITVTTKAGLAAHIAPGVKDVHDPSRPDVMRGEETQVIGVMASLGISNGLLVLPGTHSKWVRVVDGAIVSLATYLTGETYAILREHSILGRLMQGSQGDGTGFRAGLAAATALAAPGDLLNRLFSIRALGLFEALAPTESADYLSGLLIGAELRAATRDHAGPFIIIADPALTARYAAAAAALDLECRAAPPDCAAIGQFRIALAAGLLSR